MKTFLALTDFSETARNALHYVLSWCKNTLSETHVFLLNTYLLPPTPADDILRVNDELRATSVKNLAAESREAEKLIAGGGVTLEILSHMGSLKNVVNHLTASKMIDCLVSANTPGTDLAALRTSRCPILLVPPRSAYAPLGNICVLGGPASGELLPETWRNALRPDEVSRAAPGETPRELAKKRRIDLFVWQKISPASFPPQSVVDETAALATPLLVLEPPARPAPVAAG